MPLRTIMSVGILLVLCQAAVHAAPAPSAEVASIQILPDQTLVGRYPEIIGTIRAVETAELTIVASVARPDHVVKSWTWSKIVIASGDTRAFSLPHEYAVNLPGVYKVDFNVYTRGMRPLHKLSRNFTVGAAAPPATVPAAAGPAATKAAPAKAAGRTGENNRFGIGAYVNTVNTAGGATMLLWPSTYVGLQASYTMGNFTTAEGRLLLRFPLPGGINPYLGVGYASVSTERTVDTINIKTTFSDSGPTGALGVDIPLGKRWVGYAEVSGTSIDLKKEVSTGGISGTAEVKYSPVTLGFSIVYFLF